MATKKQTRKVAKVMREYKSGTLHSGKGGKVVKSRKQAIAIALSEAEWNKFKRTEDGRKQSRMRDRNPDLYNAYAEQEYTRAKPKKKVPKGYHRMPDGKLMKGSKHK